MRAVIAGMALLPAPEGRTARPGPDLERTRVRTEVLTAAGIDPNLSDPDALAALRPMLGTLLAEHPTDHALRHQRVLATLRIAQARGGEPDAGEFAELESDLETLVGARPGVEEFHRLLEAVRARRPR